MELVLRVVGWPDEITDRSPIVARFDSFGGLIGRAESARLSLPDPQRSVSRFHAHVSYSDGSFYLEDMGSANPVMVNEKPIKPGSAHQVRPGDRIRIARYALAVEFDDPDFPATQLIDPTTRALLYSTDDSGERTQIITRSDYVERPASDEVEALWKAFLDGAKVQAGLVQGLKPELMRTLGGMMRALIAGSRRLVSPRMDIKADPDHDGGAKAPQNPIRVAADDQRALVGMLRPTVPGFLAGAAAVDEVFDELAQQDAASKAAMRAALERLLARIEPAAIERRAGDLGLFESLLPGRRKARLWEAYGDLFRKPRAEMLAAWQDAFQRLYQDAYSAEVLRLRRKKT